MAIFQLKKYCFLLSIENIYKKNTTIPSHIEINLNFYCVRVFNKLSNSYYDVSSKIVNSLILYPYNSALKSFSMESNFRL